MCVLIAGGGTGGHLFPGIAVAEELRERCGAEVHFVGSSYGIERNVLPRTGFPVDLLPIRGLRREGVKGLFRAAWLVPVSVLASFRILRRQRPELVIGVGGYASFPAVLAAIVLRIPVVLLEQNASPGLATRLLARFARRVCVSFAATVALLPHARVVLTGNPIRGAAQAHRGPDQASELPRDRPLQILVFGGSAGAHHLNQIVPRAISLSGAGVRVVHQTGASDYDAVRADYRAAGLNAVVHDFIDDMPAEYACADLAICRAGATTLAELTSFGVPAILVPFPFAAGDHQRTNAQALVDSGAAWMILDRELEPERLAELLRSILDHRGELLAVRQRARGLGRPDAARRVVDECLACLAA